MNEYPTDILIDVGRQSQHLDNPNWRILDVRGVDPRLPADYRMGHISGAVALDVGRDFFRFDELTS